jgi:hypothetical protein
MQKQDREQIATKFNDWLKRNFKPILDKNGDPIIRNGLVQYGDGDILFVRILLGGSFTFATIEKARAGHKDSWLGLLTTMDTVTKMDKIEDILEMRYQQDYVMRKQTGTNFFNQFGRAPGKEDCLDEWMAKVDKCLRKKYRRPDPKKKHIKIKGIKKPAT